MGEVEWCVGTMADDGAAEGQMGRCGGDELRRGWGGRVRRRWVCESYVRVGVGGS